MLARWIIILYVECQEPGGHSVCTEGWGESTPDTDVFSESSAGGGEDCKESAADDRAQHSHDDLADFHCLVGNLSIPSQLSLPWIVFASCVIALTTSIICMLLSLLLDRIRLLNKYFC